MKENPIRSLPGIPVLLGLFAILLVGAFLMFHGIRTGAPTQIIHCKHLDKADIF